jgi:hypothetical protein
MILYISILLVSIILLLCLISSSYKYPLLAFILFVPVVDAAWSYRFGEFSLIDILDSAFILMFLLRILIKREKIYRFPFFNLFLAYFIILMLASVHIVMNSNILTALDFFTKSLYMPLAFYCLSTYFNDQKDMKYLVTVFILSGLFPVIFTMLQKITGHVWVYHVSRGLVRNVGLYHDIVTARMFLIQAVLGIALYWHYFLKKNETIKKLTLAFLFSLSIFGLYFLYSKAITAVLVLWTLIYALLRRKIYILPLALAIVFLANAATDNRVFIEVNQVFSRETEYMRGELETQYVLSGRGGIWEMYLQRWSELPLIRKFIGDGVSHGFFHNDFLRILFSGGILLVIGYYAIAIGLVSRLIREYRGKKGFIQFAAILAVVYFFVESIGQLPGFYPDIQPITWGLVALAISPNLFLNAHYSKSHQRQSNGRFL